MKILNTGVLNCILFEKSKTGPMERVKGIRGVHESECCIIFSLVEYSDPSDQF